MIISVSFLCKQQPRIRKEGNKPTDSSNLTNPIYHNNDHRQHSQLLEVDFYRHPD